MIKDKIKAFLNVVKTLLFPEYLCFICNRELENFKEHICESCKKGLIKLEGNICLSCGEKIAEPNKYCDMCKWMSREFEISRSCYEYNEFSGKLVMGLKYNKKKFLVPFMAGEMLKTINNFDIMPDIIIPVPITAKRRKFRGFNQAELLADEMELKSNFAFEVRKDIVIRTKDSVPQARLNRSERMMNLKGAFSLSNREKLTNKTVMIVDDVFTTGSTVNEVAKLLKRLNPKHIFVLTFAKTNVDHN